MAALPNSIFAFGEPVQPIDTKTYARSAHAAIHQYVDEISLFQQTRAAQRYSQAWGQASHWLQSDVSAPTPAPVMASPDSEEMSWLVTHAEELEEFVGEWLLISGDQLLGHSHNFADLRQLIAQRGLRSPFVYYVPTPEESNTVSI